MNAKLNETMDTRLNGTIREFSDFDWDGLCGAESFADGEPLIADLTIDGVECSMVGDKSGVQVMIYAKDDELIVWYFELVSDRTAVLALMEKIIIKDTTTSQLQEMGFAQIS